MIEIMRELYWIDFVMVCNPALDEYSGEYVELCRTASSLPNCTFYSQLSFSATDQLFTTIRLLVNTSVSEGFPNTFLQAAMHSVPIVSIAANPDEILNRFSMGFCTNGDVESLKQILKQLVEDDALAESIGRNGYEYVAANHDVTAQAQVLMQLLEVTSRRV